MVEKQLQSNPEPLSNSKQSTHLQPKIPVPNNLEQNIQPQILQQPKPTTSQLQQKSELNVRFLTQWLL